MKKVINNQCGHDFIIDTIVEPVEPSEDCYIPSDKYSILYKPAWTKNPDYEDCWWLTEGEDYDPE